MRIIIRNDPETGVPNGPLLNDLENWLKEKYASKTIVVLREDTMPPVTYTFRIEAPKQGRIDADDFQKILRNLKGQSLEQALIDGLKQTLAEVQESRRIPDDGLPF